MLTGWQHEGSQEHNRSRGMVGWRLFPHVRRCTDTRDVPGALGPGKDRRAQLDTMCPAVSGLRTRERTKQGTVGVAGGRGSRKPLAPGWGEAQGHRVY